MIRFHSATSVGGWPVLREDAALERAAEEGLAAVDGELRAVGGDLAEAEGDGLAMPRRRVKRRGQFGRRAG